MGRYCSTPSSSPLCRRGCNGYGTLSSSNLASASSPSADSSDRTSVALSGSRYFTSAAGRILLLMSSSNCCTHPAQRRRRHGWEGRKAMQAQDDEPLSGLLSTAAMTLGVSAGSMSFSCSTMPSSLSSTSKQTLWGGASSGITCQLPRTRSTRTRGSIRIRFDHTTCRGQSQKDSATRNRLTCSYAFLLLPGAL